MPKPRINAGHLLAIIPRINFEQVHTCNNAVRSINNCLQQMQVDRYQLPLVEIVSPSASKIANIQTQEVIVDS